MKKAPATKVNKRLVGNVEHCPAGKTTSISEPENRVQVDHSPGCSVNMPSQFSARETRLLEALLDRPLHREEVDRVAGASNGPHYIQRLRRCGLRIHTERVATVDRDGRPCRPGVYSLDPAWRERAEALLQLSRQRAIDSGGNDAAA